MVTKKEKATKYAVIWSQNVHFVTILLEPLIKKCTYKLNVMETTKYGIIWSQNVHFVTTLLVPANKTFI